MFFFVVTNKVLFLTLCRVALVIVLLVIVYVVLAFVCHGLALPSCIK